MKSLSTFALVVAACAALAQGQMVLYEDFEDASYIVDETIHFKGTDTTAAWGEVPRWHAQQNSSALLDPGTSVVRENGGNKYLEIHTSRLNGSNDFDTLGCAMSMESEKIDDYGTVYLRWAVNDISSNMLCTNDLEPGWDYDGLALVDPGVIGADGWQEGYNAQGYSKMGALFKIGGGIDFGARAGGGYEDDVAIQLPIKVWMELWIQVDHPNDRTKYWVCEQGGTPVKAMCSTGEWWGMRNQDWDNNAVENLKWIISNYGYTDDIPNICYVDTIGIEHFDTLAALEASTLNMVGPAELPLPKFPAGACQADFDGDGDVDLDDFVMLKNNFGLTPPAAGDADGDGDVDLDDFVILKNEFGVCGT